MFLLFCLTFLITLLLKRSGFIDDNTPDSILESVKLEEIDTKKWIIKRVTNDEYHIDNDYTTGTQVVHAFLKICSLILYVVLKVQLFIISLFL
jgi:hypothetical protein